MPNKRPKHTKIRFRKNEISTLSAMPSAQGQNARWRSERLRRRVKRGLVWFVTATVCLVLAVVGGAFYMVKSEWGMQTLRDQAEQIVHRVAGGKASADIGPAAIGFDADNSIVLKLENTSLKNTDSDASIVSIGSLAFGVRFLPLFKGELQLGAASISDATITTSAIPAMGGGGWATRLRDENGLISPNLATTVVFKHLHMLVDAFDGGKLADLKLHNVKIELAEKGQIRSVLVREGSLVRSFGGAIQLDINADVDGRAIKVVGTVDHDRTDDRITAVDLAVTTLDVALPGPTTPENVDRLSFRGGAIGKVQLVVSGEEDPEDKTARLALTGEVTDAVLDFGVRGQARGAIHLDAGLAQGSSKVAINRLLLDAGGAFYELAGEIDPRVGSADEENAAPAYHYNLDSKKMIAAPEGSPATPVEFTASLNGAFDPAVNTLRADEITIRSGDGEAKGFAKVELVKGKAPGILLKLGINNMLTDHVKQLWPWFVAGKPRSWVLGHVFGGTVTDGEIVFQLPPGKFGSGALLTPEESHSRYVVEGVRVDTIESLPSLRHASGEIEVRAYDVDIKMSSAMSKLASGREVKGKKGVLAIRDSNHPPVIARLDVDVSGDAAALAEYASLQPFNAFRSLPFTADDLSGQATAHVMSDIPLQKGIDPKTLDWKVDADWSGLAIAQPVGGQMLTAAEGSLVVDPAQAQISGKGQLNGVAAAFSLVEPIRPGGAERNRSVQMTLDDAARRKLAPGLDGLVSGPIRLDVDDDGQTQKVTADLGGAKLDIPWAGWRKGPGVDATAEFVMKKNGETTRLSDFRLSGKSFLVAGDIALSGGGLSTATFDTVRLNRDDSIKVTVARAGKGYKVNIDGQSFDARSIIKTYLSDSGGKSPGSDGDVVLDAKVGQVLGFNNEALSNAKITIRGGQVNLNSELGSGGAVRFTRATEGATQKLRAEATNAGATLRFLDLYKNLQRGSLAFSLEGAAGGAMSGEVDMRDFVIVNEAKLASLVSSAPAAGDRVLQSAPQKIDVSRVSFDGGHAQIAKGPKYLRIKNGVVRGGMIGASFQGALYDERGRMDMTGTFMPIYGINRIFGELPLFGELLGNGKDRGLIGVTFKLSGPVASPQLHINPLSVIAPGVFRQIFEFSKPK